MRFTKNTLLITALSIILLAVLAFTGCGTTATTTAASVTSTPAAVTTTSASAPATTVTLTPTASAAAPKPTTTTVAAPVKIELNVSAAASLTDAIKEIDALYTQENPNITIVANYGSSGTLQKQIEQGAPADVFLSAGASQMDALQAEGLLFNDSRTDLLTNQLVLVVPKDSALTLAGFADLTLDKVKKIAIGDPVSVPAGTYGKAELDRLNIYNQVQSKLILCTNVKQVLSYVEAGNVDAGIVYLTDAMISSKVKVAATASSATNSKIIYPGAVIKDTKYEAAARDYLNFLSSADARAIFVKYGFVVVQK